MVAVGVNLSWLLVPDGLVFDVVSELVRVCTCPPPLNPFAVDMHYFESLPPLDCVLATSAILSTLKEILLSGSHSYNSMSR